MGLPDPRDGSVPKVIAAEDHWAFQLPQWPDMSASTSADPCEGTAPEGPLDVLMRRPLTVAGISPSAQAEAGQLLRRLAYDLTGLPPSDVMLQALDDGLTSREYRQLVDQLLASPAVWRAMGAATGWMFPDTPTPRDMCFARSEAIPTPIVIETG